MSTLGAEPQPPRGLGLRTGSLRPPASRNRQLRIAQWVIDEGTVRIEDLAERSGVSLMTVHRDLDVLEAQGLLRKTRGRVTAIASSLFESDSTFRLGQNHAEKEAVARAALGHVEPGQALLLEDSTTGVYLARLLPARAPLTVITNFLALVDQLGRASGITLEVLGGSYAAWCDANMGAATVSTIRRLRADLVIMSTSAITDAVCYHQSQETVAIKEAMLEAAERRILYVDHTKFARRALHALAPLTAFDVVIVDWAVPEEQVDGLRAAGVTVEVAPRGAGRPGEG
jgi:DeoR/GlpR family transcriptional regulator of sugar metabolism